MKVVRFINGESDWRDRLPRLDKVSLRSLNGDSLARVLEAVSLGYLYTVSTQPMLGLTSVDIAKLLELRTGITLVRMPVGTFLSHTSLTYDDPIVVVKMGQQGEFHFFELKVEVSA